MKFPSDLLQKCWFIAGPTASGKTALGIELAQSISGEIVSLDSMAIFRGMNIGTAKPSKEEQARVPHHLIDVVEPHEDFSTADYLQHAVRACEEILSRHRTPVFVGGTGLYLRSVLRGVFAGPPADWNYRRQLEEQARLHETSWLHQQLLKVDPKSAQRLHPNDARRLIRALEIHHLTGEPASELQDEAALPEVLRPQHVYWLHPDRDWLYDRINRRVEQMMEQGLEAEVHDLLERTPPIARTARQALGYREIIDWIDGHIASREATVALIQTRTRQFAKRQHTWFRNLEECRELRVDPTDDTRTLLHRLLDPDKSSD